MLNFEITKQSKKSRARLGLLETSHGVVETPAFVPVATQATIKTLTAEETKATNSQLVISNTFHLHLKPGEDIVKQGGGLHKFSNWDRPIMTDSGGFQVFSLGFGRDLQVGKVLKFFEGGEAKEQIKVGQQPKFVKITPEGVHFRSPINGEKLFIGPKESMAIQAKLGADIIFAFDECTAPLSTLPYIKRALKRTHDWAKICVEQKIGKHQALFGIVQGSHYQDLRYESSTFINSLPFDGFGIGGDLGSTKEMMVQILDWTIPFLDQAKPRHLLGIGRLEDMEMIIRGGVDTFDCTVPTHYARNGIAFTSAGKLDMRKREFLTDKKPLDPKCGCPVCGVYKRNFIAHMFKAKEMTALRHLTFHNLYYFNHYVAQIREQIKKGKI